MGALTAAEFGKVLVFTQGLHTGFVANWTQEPYQLGRNLFASFVTCSGAFPALETAVNLSSLPSVSATFFLAPLLLSATRFALRCWPVFPDNPLYLAVDFAHRKWDRFAQVINLVCCVALLWFGAPLWGWTGVALGAQILALGFALYYDAKKQKVQEATNYIRANARKPADQRDPCPPSVKPYYHLVTILNEEIPDSRLKDTQREQLVELINVADSPDRAGFAQNLTSQTFDIENRPNKLQKDACLSRFLTDLYVAQRHRAPAAPQGAAASNPV